MSRETKCRAVILKKQAFNEGDEIITFFSLELGKIRCLAKSVKSPKSKLQQKLQGLFLVDLTITQSSRLPKIISAEPVEVFSRMRENLESLKRAFYAQELVLKFTPDEQKNQSLFNLLLGFLRFLNSGNGEALLDLGLIKFKMELLSALGFTIRNQVRAGEHTQVFFSPNKGGFLEEPSADAFRVDPVVYRLFLELMPLDFISLEKAHNIIGEKDLQNLLSRFIEHYLERKVKSEKYLRQ